jgi:hypothetical protein
MHIDTTVAGAAIVALAIFAHAWHGRITGNPVLLSVLGWVINILTALALLACWLRH